MSWQLNPSNSINITGLIVIGLAFLGAFVSRKNKMCRLSFMWLLYSFVILCVIGWGTAENGLVLYSLYFSWAAFILIFSLALKAEDLSGVRLVVPAFVVSAASLMLYANLPAMSELVGFAVKYYPYSW